MNISVTGKHVEVTPAMREHIESGVRKLKKFFDGILDVDVILSVEKRVHRAEINILADGIHLHGEASSEDLYKSIDVALARIQTQILRYKEKLKNHRLRNRKPSQIQRFPLRGVQVNVLSGEDITVGEKNPRIIRTRSYEMKPMSLDEAAMQMDLIQEDVLVFRDVETDRVSVLCRRNDGNYELITPEV